MDTSVVIREIRGETGMVSRLGDAGWLAGPRPSISSCQSKGCVSVIFSSCCVSSGYTLSRARVYGGRLSERIISCPSFPPPLPPMDSHSHYYRPIATSRLLATICGVQERSSQIQGVTWFYHPKVWGRLTRISPNSLNQSQHGYHL